MTNRRNNNITARCPNCKGPAKTMRRVICCATLRCGAVTPR